jgi:hypothetical protein
MVILKQKRSDETDKLKKKETILVVVIAVMFKIMGRSFCISFEKNIFKKQRMRNLPKSLVTLPYSSMRYLNVAMQIEQYEERTWYKFYM